MDKKKLEELNRNLLEKGYEVVKSIGRGGFGEVLLVRKSNIKIY